MAKPELSVEQLIENKFYNSRTFSEEIEKIAKRKQGHEIHGLDCFLL